jgi:hypothetical protein
VSEHDEQAAVIDWARDMEWKWPCLKWLHSSLNGIFIPGKRTTAYKIINHLKAEGMVKGIPDLFLPVARKGYHGLYIEMKKGHAEELTPEQIDFIDFANDEQYCAARCDGRREAVEQLEWYLS